MLFNFENEVTENRLGKKRTVFQRVIFSHFYTALPVSETMLNDFNLMDHPDAFTEEEREEIWDISGVYFIGYPPIVSVEILVELFKTKGYPVHYYFPNRKNHQFLKDPESKKDALDRLERIKQTVTTFWYGERLLVDAFKKKAFLPTKKYTEDDPPPPAPLVFMPLSLEGIAAALKGIGFWNPKTYTDLKTYSKSGSLKGLSPQSVWTVKSIPNIGPWSTDQYASYMEDYENRLRKLVEQLTGTIQLQTTKAQPLVRNVTGRLSFSGKQ